MADGGNSSVFRVRSDQFAMRTLIRHFVALLVLAFIFKIAIQAQEPTDHDSVPKSLLLSSLNTAQPIPNGKIDTQRIIATLRKQ